MIKNIAIYKEILDNMDEGVYFVDRERRILYWNKGAERITGFTAEQVEGHFCHDNILNHVTENGTNLCMFGCPLHASIEDGKGRQAEIFLHHAAGHLVPINVHTMPLRDENGEIIGAVETFSDNSKVVNIRHQIRRLEDAALLDPVTGIGNRRYIERRLQMALLEFQQQDAAFGVLFMDIDDFKKVNDTFGHTTGDQVLAMVANTMKNYLRSDDALGRWGGEEFIAIVRGVDKAGLKTAADKLNILVLNSTLRLENKLIRVGISIGMSTPTRGDSVQTLVERADAAMYAQKRQNKSTTDKTSDETERKGP